MNPIYRKSFIFEAERFEEYQNGLCTNTGKCNTRIIAGVVSSDCIAFMLKNDVPGRIKRNFGLPMLGMDDVLSDRIQYGRLPISLYSSDSQTPIVCNIFNNMTCIRFAMLSPLRIIEFYGNFVEIRNA